MGLSSFDTYIPTPEVGCDTILDAYRNKRFIVCECVLGVVIKNIIVVICFIFLFSSFDILRTLSDNICRIVHLQRSKIIFFLYTYAF